MFLPLKQFSCAISRVGRSVESISSSVSMCVGATSCGGWGEITVGEGRGGKGKLRVSGVMLFLNMGSR